MAKISDQGLYINLVNLTREEAAVLLVAVLNALSADDESMASCEKSVGLESGSMRPTLEKVGAKIDDEFPKMLEVVESIMG